MTAARLLNVQQITGESAGRVPAFVATAEERALSAESRALGLTEMTLVRQVTALEERLGDPLFERAGTPLALTPVGYLIAELLREMG